MGDGEMEGDGRMEVYQNQNVKSKYLLSSDYLYFIIFCS